jgi:hypothetical protein
MVRGVTFNERTGKGCRGTGVEEEERLLSRDTAKT